MARCKDKQRANAVFEHYKNYTALRPVVIYSGISGQRVLLEEIKQKEHKIIVCVNMLGEGFDLPQLKSQQFMMKSKVSQLRCSLLDDSQEHQEIE